MSTHISAQEGQIAETVLLPGDPLRAKFIAETYLEDAVCYNEVRGMYGFTGTYKGIPVSVQGTGMGQASVSVYVNELFRFYNVQNAIRVGTCGATKSEIALRDVILAQGACSDSALNTHRFGAMHYAPIADFSLLKTAYDVAVEKEKKPWVGLCVSSDNFYDDDENWRLWEKYGALCIEMETAEIYTLAAKFRRRALSILTVSDHIVLGGMTSSWERQKTFGEMVQLALDTVVAFNNNKDKA